MKCPRFRLWKVAAVIIVVSLLFLLAQQKIFNVVFFAFSGNEDKNGRDNQVSDFSISKGELEPPDSLKTRKEYQKYHDTLRFDVENGIPKEAQVLDKSFLYGVEKGSLKSGQQNGDSLRFRTEFGGQLDKELPFRVVTAMEKAVQFFTEEYANVNVDGLFGMRMCQGRIIECLEVCSNEEARCPSELVIRLKKLNKYLDYAAEIALPYASREDPAYYTAFKNIVEAPYKVQYIPESLGDAIAPMGSLGNDYFGDWVNPCFAGLMGTLPGRDGIARKCTINDYCWNQMTREGGAEYYITHQLLYFIFGEVYGCQEELNERVRRSPDGSSVRERQRKICGHVFTEATLESINGRVAIHNQDLFVEQVLLCGIIGFQDFFNEPWIRMILGWQTARGCFGEPPAKNVLQIIPQAQGIMRQTGRKLLREKNMGDGCLSHMSGLTLGVFGVYMRYYVDQLYT